MIATDRIAATQRVSGAIRMAAARTGVDFSYLYNQARIESGLDPNIRARTSSATGLFQFIDQTWLATLHRHGAQHGLGWAASAIERGPSGRYRVADPAMRQQVMALRRQPEAASAMAAEFAADNRAHLENRLGRAVEPVDLYLAHFLGAGGATRFLRAHAASPDAPAAPAFPAQARANRAVFHDRAGNPRSYGEIRARFAAKLGVDAMPADAARTRTPTAPSVAPLPVAPSPVAPSADPSRFALTPGPGQARLAYLLLAQLGA